mgnify:FL=1
MICQVKLSQVELSFVLFHFDNNDVLTKFVERVADLL